MVGTEPTGTSQAKQDEPELERMFARLRKLNGLLDEEATRLTNATGRLVCDAGVDEPGKEAAPEPQWNLSPAAMTTNREHLLGCCTISRMIAALFVDRLSNELNTLERIYEEIVRAREQFERAI